MIHGMMLGALGTILFLGLALVEGVVVYYKDSVQPSSVAYTLECNPSKVESRINELIDMNLMYLSGVTLTSKTANKADVKFLSCSRLLTDDLTIREDPRSGSKDGYAHYPGIPANPYDAATPAALSLSNDACCSSQQGACQGCFVGHGVCLLKYSVLDKNKVLLFTEMFESACRLCTQVPCASGKCMNGEYADVAALKDPVTDISINHITCKPCSPGTWNTCINKDTCYW